MSLMRLRRFGYLINYDGEEKKVEGLILCISEFS